MLGRVFNLRFKAGRRVGEILKLIFPNPREINQHTLPQLISRVESSQTLRKALDAVGEAICDVAIRDFNRRWNLKKIPERLSFNAGLLISGGLSRKGRIGRAERKAEVARIRKNAEEDARETAEA